MQPRLSALTLALALAAFAPVAVCAADQEFPTATLPDGGEFDAGPHRFQTARISGGDFVRMADGVTPASVEISGRDGLRVEGGRFRTAHPVNPARGVELARGQSISLYNKIHPDPAAAAISGAPPAAGFQLYTADEVGGIFASGDPDRIRSAFTSSDANGVAPTPLREADVRIALGAAKDLVLAGAQTAWQLTADHGDVVIDGGLFDFHSSNQNRIQARTGKLVWNGGQLVSQGGGGETTLQGTAGIALLGGVIRSTGAVAGAISPIHYDPRQRLDRDRWTLGKYLVLLTDRDIDVGRQGQPGPDVRVADGMLQISPASLLEGAGKKPTTQHLNLRSGSISLQGDHRSTLLAIDRGLSIVTVVSGGTLNVASAQVLIDTPTESPSMWNMQTVLEEGTINLDNGQLIGPGSAIKGGVLNLAGISAIVSPTGALTISGGTINVGPQSFIGAIKGDSRARSPYPTAQHDLEIRGATLNFIVAPPADGETLAVGTHIGGIFAGDNNPARQSAPTLAIGQGTRINVDTGALPAGKYRVADFASVDDGDGRLAIAAAVPVHNPAGNLIGSLDTTGALSLQVK